MAVETAKLPRSSEWAAHEVPEHGMHPAELAAH